MSQDILVIQFCLNHAADYKGEDQRGMKKATASQLYAPYGGMRYQSGAMPTDYGFTGRPSAASCRAVWPPAAPRDRAT